LIPRRVLSLWGGVRDLVRGSDWQDGLARDQLDVAIFFLPGPCRQNANKRSAPLGQVGKEGFDLFQAVEELETLGPAPEFARRLRAPQEEDTKQRDLPLIQLKMVKQVMPIFWDARSGTKSHGSQFLFTQRIHTGFDCLLVIGNNGITVRRLIACRNQAVERKRIVLGCDPLLFKEATENSCFNGSQGKQGHKGLLAQGERKENAELWDGQRRDFLNLVG
jgi:hypothetical protein